MPKDPSFVEALAEQLSRGSPVESPFAPTPEAKPGPMPPGSFPTLPADAVMNPGIVDKLIREREAYLRSITNNGNTGTHEYHYDVFIVHRPPGACFECKLATKDVLSERETILASGGDPEEVMSGFDFQSCPHIRRTEYINLVNQAHQKKITIASMREETLPNGSVQVCVGWWTPIFVASTKNTAPRDPATST